MEKLRSISLLILLLLLQACYFGAGLVEEQLTDNIILMAINSSNEAEIIYSEKGNSVYHTLVPRVVTSVGHNENFIIAKSHPNDSLTHYFIIEVNKISKDNHEQADPMTFQQFESERKRLSVPDELGFTINLKDDH